MSKKVFIESEIIGVVFSIFRSSWKHAMHSGDHIDSGEIVQNALPDTYDYNDRERYQGSSGSKEEPVDVCPDIDWLFS